jgi:hypothetical protein
MSVTLQHRAHQHNSKIELEKEKPEITSAPPSSSSMAPDGASFVEDYYHQRVWPQ